MDLGRRIPGRRRAAISPADIAGAARRQSLRHRRSRSGDLRLSRRRRVVLRPLPPGLSRRQDRAARAQLSLQRHDRHRRRPGHRRARTRADRRDGARHARAHRHPCRADGTRRSRDRGEDDRRHDRRAQLFLDRQRPRHAGVAEQPVVRRLRRALPHRFAVHGDMRGVRPLRHALPEALPRPARGRPGGAGAVAGARRRGRRRDAARRATRRRTAAGAARRRAGRRDHGAAAPHRARRPLRQRSRAPRGRRRARHRRRVPRGARRPRVAAHPARRQGARISGRVHHRARGRRAAALLERARRAHGGGRAPAVLRRDDAGQGRAHSHPRAATVLARPDAGARAVAVPARHRERAGAAPAQTAAGASPRTGNSRCCSGRYLCSVVPAQAGTHGAANCGLWNMDPRFRGDDMPLFAARLRRSPLTSRSPG